MKRECLHSIYSLFHFDVNLGMFLSKGPFGTEDIVFLSLAPLVLAFLFLLEDSTTLSSLVFIYILFGPMMILEDHISQPYRLLVFVTVPALWAAGYENARKCRYVTWKNIKKITGDSSWTPHKKWQ